MADKGKVLTVLGPAEPNSLGCTLTHEHFSLDFSVAFTSPSLEDQKKIESKFSIPNLGWIRQNPYSHKENITFHGDDVDEMVEAELHGYRSAGGGTIVENTITGLCRNIPLLKRLSLRTGVTVIAGTGYYVSGSQSPATLQLGVEALAATMTRDITEGCEEDSSVRCGLLGEVGCSWPLTEFETRSVRATGEVQQQLGCPVMFHPGRNHQAPEEILRLYTEAGGDSGKAVMAHLDRTIHTLEELEEFANMGSYLEYDLFGIETSHYQLSDEIDMPSDAQRIARIRHLVDAGYGDKILLSHDIHTRHRLTACGGHGFCHILRSVLPKMVARGIAPERVQAFVTDNPQRWLTFSK